MPTISIQVSQGIDDGAYQVIADIWRTNHTAITMGYGGTYIGVFHQAFRFLNGPPKSTIESAILRVNIRTSGNILSNVVGIGEANTPDFTANPIPRPETIAKVPWDGVKDYGWISLDITAIIQEIVNLPEWKQGNPIGIKWLDRGSTDYCSVNHYDGDPALAAILEITYTPITPPPTYTLTVESTPINVPLTLNGESVGNTPISVTVEEGSHTVEVPPEMTT